MPVRKLHEVTVEANARVSRLALPFAELGSDEVRQKGMPYRLNCLPEEAPVRHVAVRPTSIQRGKWAARTIVVVSAVFGAVVVLAIGAQTTLLMSLLKPAPPVVLSIPAYSPGPGCFGAARPHVSR